jgi:hypothetical protein
MAQILYDLFPAHVAIAPANHPTPLTELSSSPLTPNTAPVLTARVIITENRILIAQDSASGPLPVYSQSYSPGNFHKAAFKSEESYILTDTGQKIAFKKDDACGCGSRLRSWNPYNIVSSKNDPTE